MLTRPKHPKESSTMVVVDYPVGNDIANNIPYSSASGLTLMDDLHRQGIKQKDTFYTYLSYARPDSDSYDWIKEFSKKNSLEPLSEESLLTIPGTETSYSTILGIAGIPYFLLPHQKDLYVSISLFTEFLNLLGSIKKVKPKLIIILGKWSLFFLTGGPTYAQTQSTRKLIKPLGGLDKYRVSMMSIHPSLEASECLLIPLLPVTSKFKSPDKIPIMNWDYNKVGTLYKRLLSGDLVKGASEVSKGLKFALSFEGYCTELNSILKKVEEKETYVSVDIETRQYTIDCIGLGIEVDKAVCIPFSSLENPIIWSEAEEELLVALISEILKHSNCKIVGQNFPYDAQYLWKFWLLKVEATIDTMILHHCMYNYMPKSLSFLASIYSENYIYWKDMQDHSK